METPLVDPRMGEDLAIPLVGIADLILKSDDGPVIVDCKTAARSGDLLEMAHEVQLTCYGWLYRQVAGRAEAELQIRRLVKTKVPRVETHRFPARNERHFSRFFSVIDAYLDDVDRRRFVYRPSWHCGACDYGALHCRKYCGSKL